MLKKFLAVSFCLVSSMAQADQIWDLRNNTQVQNIADALKGARLVVSGESHYDPATVAIHAEIARALGPDTLVGWEFLNTIDRATIDAVLEQLRTHELTVEAALGELFPGQQAPVEYSALLELVATSEARVIPTNLTREQKQPVTRNGIEAVDPKLLPPDFALGSERYFERFKTAIGGHPLPYPVENYFDAQCLTDDVMAYSLLAEKSQGKRMLVTGAFHGDYKLGVVDRLRIRSGTDVVYVKVLHSDEWEGDTMDEALRNPKFGDIADIVYVIEQDGPPAISKH